MKLNMRILFFILLFFLSKCQVFFEHGIDGESRILYNYFSDTPNGFYVDIGAYDPIFASNTLDLYVNGWDGVNIDANPSRANRFFMERPDQTNLNFVIGDNDTFTILYELTEDSSSKISKEVKEFVSGYKPVREEILVPSLSLKQVCERYFYRRPILMNLDVEGVGSKVLESNDWTNPVCVPDIIISEFNQETVETKLTLPEVILKSHGYQKVPGNFGLNQFYILETEYEKYRVKFEQANATSSKFSIININVISGAIGRSLNVSTRLMQHYEPKTDMIYYKFVKIEENVNIENINKESNLLSQFQNRPIVLFYFNPYSNSILIRDKFTIKQVTFFTHDFVEITIIKPDGEKLIIYIFDHKYEGPENIKIEDRIISLSENLAEIKANGLEGVPEETAKVEQEEIVEESEEEAEEQKLFNEIVSLIQELNKESKELSRLSASYKSTEKRYRSSYINTSNLEISNLQSIDNQLSSIYNKTTVTPTPPSSMFKAHVTTISTIQLMTMISTIVLSLVLCCITCCRRENDFIKAQTERKMRARELRNSA